MDCVNHTGKAAAAYCQNCGKALCTECIAAGAMNPAARGMILCQNCIGVWQAANPFVAPQGGVPNPSVAAVLGLIPGVGAMYNGQFIKGLIHVVIFAVLVSASHVFHIFGLFIAAWIIYQSFEAYHTARARRDGQPLPDPLGLNDLGNWFNAGAPHPGQQTPPGAAGNPAQGPAANQSQGPWQAPFTPPYQQPPWQSPYQSPFGGPYTPPGQGFTGTGIPPVPPEPPIPPPPMPPMGNCWGRSEPIGAIVLIALGVLFALGQMDVFSGRIFEYSWPILLIGLGIWLIVRRVGDSRGDK